MKVSSIIGLLIFACATQAFAESTQLEPMRLVKMDQDYTWTGDASTSPTSVGMTVAVASKGCTSARDFRVDVNVVGKTQRIRIVRITPDTCKSVEETVEVEFSSLNLKLANFYPIIFENPVLPSGITLSPGTMLTVEK
jgi:hypothetical protein